MERRGFLSLLVATPVLAQTAPQLFAQAPPAPVLPVPLVGEGVIRRYVLPFGPSFAPAIRPGGVERFEVMLQRTFRPERLIVSSFGVQGPATELGAVGPRAPVDFLSIAANGDPQIEADGLSSDLFEANQFGGRIYFDVVPPGQTVVLAVRNPHAFHVHFNAIMVGEALEPERARCGELDEFGRSCWLYQGHSEPHDFDDLEGEPDDFDDFDDDDVR